MKNASKRKNRYNKLRKILQEHRLKILEELQCKIHDVRTGGAAVSEQGVRDEVETSEAEVQNDIEFTFLQMKADTLSKIGEALVQLEEGAYGYCCECDEEIAEQRLSALPFAVRCKDCEETREIVRQKQTVTDRRIAVSLFAEISG